METQNCKILVFIMFRLTIRNVSLMFLKWLNVAQEILICKQVTNNRYVRKIVIKCQNITKIKLNTSDNKHFRMYLPNS